MESLLFQIFLYANIFIIGGVIALVVQYAYAHYKQRKEEKEHKTVEIPASVKEQMVHAAESDFKSALADSATGLEHDLGNTSSQLNSLLKEFGTEILDDEMKLFREHLEEIREKTEKAVGGATGEVATQQADLEAKLAARQTEFEAKLLALQTELEHTLVGRQGELDTVLTERKKKLEAKLDEELTIEKERLLRQIDTKLADAVGSFLVDTLEHNVDLGAQKAYLVSLLEEHKEEFKKEVGDEATG